jgi:hypothetical protein
LLTPHEFSQHNFSNAFDKLVKARADNLPPSASLQILKKRAAKAITQFKLNACAGCALIANVRRTCPLKVHRSIGRDIEISFIERFLKTFYSIRVKAAQVNDRILTVSAVNRNDALGVRQDS